MTYRPRQRTKPFLHHLYIKTFDYSQRQSLLRTESETPCLLSKVTVILLSINNM